MNIVMGGLDIRVRIIRVVKGGSRTSVVTLRFMPRIALGMQQVRLKDRMPRQEANKTRSTPA